MDDLDRFLATHPEHEGTPWGELIRGRPYRKWRRTEALREFNDAAFYLLMEFRIFRGINRKVDLLRWYFNKWQGKNWHGWRQ